MRSNALKFVDIAWTSANTVLFVLGIFYCTKGIVSLIYEQTAELWCISNYGVGGLNNCLGTGVLFGFSVKIGLNLTLVATWSSLLKQLYFNKFNFKWLLSLIIKTWQCYIPIGALVVLYARIDEKLLAMGVRNIRVNIQYDECISLIVNAAIGICIVCSMAALKRLKK